MFSLLLSGVFYVGYTAAKADFDAMTPALMMMRDSFKAVIAVFIKHAFLDLGIFVLCNMVGNSHSNFLAKVLAKNVEAVKIL